MQRRALFALAPGLLLAGGTGPAAADRLPRAVNHADGVALRGHDVLAWHEEARPRLGAPAFAITWQGVAWHFATADRAARFAASPAHFAPRFGGFCAYGVARGYKVDIDPEAWHIREGVLYLNWDRGVQRQWLRDVTGYIARAEANWPRLAER